MNPALISLRIASYVYFLLAIGMVLASLFLDQAGGIIFVALFAAAWGYLHIKIRQGLLAQKYWAWIAGIIVSGMSLLSLLFPLGIMGLIGLLKHEVRMAFNSRA
jgi:hypothetical protein